MTVEIVSIDSNTPTFENSDERPIAPLQKAHFSSEYPDEEQNSILLPCIICNRTFFPRALERHQKVCEKLQFKKRDVFETTKKRKEGFTIPLLGVDPPNKRIPKKKSKWREKHQEFLRQIRAAKTSKSDSSDEGEESKKFIPSDYEKCPHCERYFGPRAVDRHVEWCREQKSRRPRSLTSEDAEAVQRLKARTKYTPPKPGKSHWRAPKKKDVISSIPPQGSSPDHAKPTNGLLPPGLRTPPVYRRTSSPSPLRHPPRHMSPSPIPLSRKGSCSSLPPGPPRNYGGSLGRAAGKKFSSMIQSYTGCPSGYGLSSGYGSSQLYGSPTAYAPIEFQRSNSFRSPKRRQCGRMARHRDLASDMLASVCMNDKIKREDPEGDEASNMEMYDEDYTTRKSSYDPFSAAELQLQNLLFQPEAYQSEKMGGPHSVKDYDMTNSYFDESDRVSRLRPIGSRSLCSLGFDSFDLNSLNLQSPDDDSSGLESIEHSPIEGRSIITGTEEILASFSPSKAVESYLENSLNEFDANLNILQSNNRYNSRLPKLNLQKATGTRKIPEGASTWKYDSSPSPNSRNSPPKWNSKKYRLPESYSVNRQSRGSSLPRLSSPSPAPSIKSVKSSISPKNSYPSFCSECGYKYNAFAKFCCYCGAKRVCNY